MKSHAQEGNNATDRLYVMLNGINYDLQENT